MATDLEIAIDKIAGLLSTGFDDFNTKDKSLDKETAFFWKRIKNKFSEGFGARFEAAPVETLGELKTELNTLAKSGKIKMNYVMYLHKMGIPIE